MGPLEKSLGEAVLMCIPNVCFERKLKNRIKFFSNEILNFCFLKKPLYIRYIAWACFHNVA